MRIVLAVASAALLAVGVGSVRLSTDLASLSNEEEWKERPIAKVVNLLKDMQSQLEVEGQQDEETYETMACWCESNDQEKTKSIADGEKKIKELTALIEESTAAAKTLDTDIKALETGIEESKKALGEAEEIRAKELAEFNAEEKDAIQSVSSLKGALNSLGKANAGSAFEQQQSLIQVQQVLRRRSSMALAAVAPQQRAEVNDFLMTPTDGISLLQESSKLRVKQPASGAIFGMLGQMKESFETNMATSAKEEEQSAAEYAQLKTAKTKEVEASTSKVFTKKEELAKAKETKARSEQDLDDTEDALAADTEFLKNLKGQCVNIDSEYEARKKARMEEVTAVGETMGILTSDEANDAMTKSMSLLQARAQSKREGSARTATAKFLRNAGSRLRSPRLSYLAVRVQNDAFAKIQENIDKMVGQLGKEQKDEVVKKDDCVTDLNTNDKQTAERNTYKTDVETEINDVESEMGLISDEEKTLREDIAKVQIALKDASANREKENKDFQVTIQDQRATQAILTKALERMKDFYEKKDAAAALLQVRARRASQEPPAFEKMEKNAGGGGVITMLQGIIDESLLVEKDAKTAETDAQEAYEIFVGDSNKQIEALSKQLVNDEEVYAKDNQKDVEAIGDKSTAVQDILKLGEVATTLHGGCDFTMDNFGVRQKARSEEMDALKESKQIFGAALL